MINEEHHYVGHRQRIKDKLLDGLQIEFADYELLEMLLFFSIPRKDVKPLAKELLKRFGSLCALIQSDKSKLLSVEQVNENVCVTLYLIRELINRVLRQRIVNTPVISSWSALLEYLKYTMGDLKTEQLRVIFLNKKNILIAEEVLITGTIDQIPVYPREVVKRALFHEAGSIILVHNHPSGSSKPSKPDIALTEKIVQACNLINITVHDHVIITNNDYYSFKSNMLL